MKTRFWIGFCGVMWGLAACGTPERFAVSLPEVTRTERIAFASVEVRDVSLPSYAAADEINVQAADGTL